MWVFRTSGFCLQSQCFHFQTLLAVCGVSGLPRKAANAELLVQAATGFHHSPKETVHKQYEAAEAVTRLNSARHVRARRGPLLISRHCQKPEDHSFGGKKQPCHHHYRPHPFSSSAQGANTALDPGSCPGSSEPRGLLKRLVAMLSRLHHFASGTAALLFHLSSLVAEHRLFGS